MTSGTRSEPGTRLNYIDGLRALAALAVLAYHAWVPRTEIAGPDSPLTQLFYMGAHGVDLFFVLSGFCLAYPTLKRVRRGAPYAFDAPSFVARRLVRIVPPYYAAIAVLSIAISWLHLRSAGLGITALLEQLLFLDKSQSYLSGTFWTLAVELRWYVAFPLLLLLYVRAPRVFALLGVMAYVLFYATLLHSVDVGTLPAFMLGIWAADLEITQSPLRRYAFAVGAPCAVVSYVLMSGDQFYAVQPVGVVAAFAFVVAAGAIGGLRRALEARVLVALGIASYSIYLLHEPVIAYFELIRGASPLPAGVAALLFSLAFWWLCERPWLSTRLRDRAVRRVHDVVATVIAFLVPLAAEPVESSSEREERERRPALAAAES